MKHIMVILLIGLSCWQLAAGDEKGATSQPAAEKKFDPAAMANPGPYEFNVKYFDWKDLSRNKRPVPVKLYYPAGVQAAPLIIVSHGLGGSRDGLEYISRHWASYGFVCLNVQHVGSDESVWRGRRLADIMPAMRRAARDPLNALNRTRDVSFCIDKMLKMSKRGGEFPGMIDENKIGIAGHSFGAWTALAAVGQTSKTAKNLDVQMQDKRIKAAVALSSPFSPQNDFSAITVPIFHFTGTNDVSPINSTTADDRRKPFDMIQNAEEYLVIFDGADHMTFSGEKPRGIKRADPRLGEWHSLIKQATTIFWQAWLQDSSDAKKWLRGEGAKKAFEKYGTYEQKKP